MRLLMVTASSPYPPISGAGIRRWEELRYLARRHDVTAVFYQGGDAAQGQSCLNGLCRTVAVPHPRRLAEDDLAISRGAPWPLRWYGTVVMAGALREVRPAAFDAVIVDSLYMTLYHDLFVPRGILQEHNIESQLARQFAQPKPGAPPPHGSGGPALWRTVALQLEAYENRTWPAFPLRVTVSAADKAVIDGRCAVGQTVVVENGADVSAPVVRHELGPPTMLFVGALDYYPNIDAAFYLVNAIMPAVWAHRPDIGLIIAGRCPGPALSALPRDPRVKLVATPIDMRAVAAQASVSVVPLRVGGGTRLKVLDSLAWGLPVVSTRLGCAGLALTDGEHVVIRDRPDAFAEAVIRLLSDAVFWRRLSGAGRTQVERRYRWEGLFEQFEAELLRFANVPESRSVDTTSGLNSDTMSRTLAGLRVGATEQR